MKFWLRIITFVGGEHKTLLQNEQTHCPRRGEYVKIGDVYYPVQDVTTSYYTNGELEGIVVMVHSPR